MKDSAEVTTALYEDVSLSSVRSSRRFLQPDEVYWGEAVAKVQLRPETSGLSSADIP